MRRTERILRYLGIMFPPLTHVPQAAAMFSGTYFTLQALGGLTPLRLGSGAVAGGACLLLALLLVRLYDDVRDADADLRLARSGDPRYASRPTVTGLVTVPEIRALCAANIVALLGLNLAFGGPLMRLTCLLGGLLTWLSFRWFFIPALARDPKPLAYLARKSLTVVLGIYVVAVFADGWEASRLTVWTAPLVLAPCLEAAAWEVSRKIRIESDETAYGTYSKALGPRGAAALTALFILAAGACLIPVAAAARLSWLYSAAVTGAAAAAILACFRFGTSPSRAGANLRPYAEWFGAVANGGLAAAVGLRYGGILR